MSGNEKARLQALDVTLEGMRQAFNKNHQAYAHAISALDGHFSVLRAVINDIHRDLRAITATLQDPAEPTIPGDVTVNAQGDIDWDTYYGWYNEFLRKRDLEEAAAREAALLETSAVESIPTREELFGGNHGSRSGQVSEGSPHTSVTSG